MGNPAFIMTCAVGVVPENTPGNCNTTSCIMCGCPCNQATCSPCNPSVNCTYCNCGCTGTTNTSTCPRCLVGEYCTSNNQCYKPCASRPNLTVGCVCKLPNTLCESGYVCMNEACYPQCNVGTTSQQSCICAGSVCGSGFICTRDGKCLRGCAVETILQETCSCNSSSCGNAMCSSDGSCLGACAVGGTVTQRCACGGTCEVGKICTEDRNCVFPVCAVDDAIEYSCWCGDSLCGNDNVCNNNQICASVSAACLSRSYNSDTNYACGRECFYHTNGSCSADRCLKYQTHNTRQECQIVPCSSRTPIEGDCRSIDDKTEYEKMCGYFHESAHYESNASEDGLVVEARQGCAICPEPNFVSVDGVCTLVNCSSREINATSLFACGSNDCYLNSNGLCSTEECADFEIDVGRGVCVPLNCEERKPLNNSCSHPMDMTTCNVQVDDTCNEVCFDFYRPIKGVCEPLACTDREPILYSCRSVDDTNDEEKMKCHCLYEGENGTESKCVMYNPNHHDLIAEYGVLMWKACEARTSDPHADLFCGEGNCFHQPKGRCGEGCPYGFRLDEEGMCMLTFCSLRESLGESCTSPYDMEKCLYQPDTNSCAYTCHQFYMANAWDTACHLIADCAQRNPNGSSCGPDCLLDSRGRCAARGYESKESSEGNKASGANTAAIVVLTVLVAILGVVVIIVVVVLAMRWWKGRANTPNSSRGEKDMEMNKISGTSTILMNENEN